MCDVMTLPKRVNTATLLQSASMNTAFSKSRRHFKISIVSTTGSSRKTGHTLSRVHRARTRTATLPLLHRFPPRKHRAQRREITPPDVAAFFHVDTALVMHSTVDTIAVMLLSSVGPHLCRTHEKIKLPYYSLTCHAQPAHLESMEKDKRTTRLKSKDFQPSSAVAWSHQ